MIRLKLLVTLARNSQKWSLDLPEDIAHKKEKRHRHIQYLNVWESFALLVNHGELKNINILEHFKANLMRP